jgi:membrane fusion protein (multidrug efflux system)
MGIFSGIRRACAALFASAAALGFASGCGPNGAQAGAKGERKPTTVEVMRVERELLRDVESFGGQLIAEQSVVAKPEIEGMVASVEYEDGQRVAEGDILVRLRDGEQRARLAEAAANLELARHEHARTSLLVDRNAASRAQHDRATAELAVAQSRVDLAQLELDRTRIRAPFDGVVGMRLVSVGERVDEDTPLAQVDAVDRLQLIFPSSEHAVAFARVGTPIEAQVGPYPGEKFPGTVFFVAPTVDPDSRRVYIKAWVANDDGRLRAGLYANLDMEIARRENAIIVPESSVVYDRKGTYVWRVESDDSVVRVPIELGLRKGGRVEVTLGLESGDEIIVAGTHKVSEGKPIRRAPPSADLEGHAQNEPAAVPRSEEGT